MPEVEAPVEESLVKEVKVADTVVLDDWDWDSEVVVLMECIVDVVELVLLEEAIANKPVARAKVWEVIAVFLFSNEADKTDATEAEETDAAEASETAEAAEAEEAAEEAAAAEETDATEATEAADASDWIEASETTEAAKAAAETWEATEAADSEEIEDNSSGEKEVV